MAEIDDARQPLKLAITYRVIWHWRLPIFQRLARQPDYDVRVFHGEDFPGTKTVNASRIEGVPHVQMFTIRWLSRLLPLPEWPICPGLLYHLWRFRPDVILSEANSNLLNNFQVFLYAGLTKTPVVFWTLGALRGKTSQNTFQRVYPCDHSLDGEPVRGTARLQLDGHRIFPATRLCGREAVQGGQLRRHRPRATTYRAGAGPGRTAARSVGTAGSKSRLVCGRRDGREASGGLDRCLRDCVGQDSEHSAVAGGRWSLHVPGPRACGHAVRSDRRSR